MEACPGTSVQARGLPARDDQEARLFWMDIEAGQAFARHPDGLIEEWHLPERVGSFGLTTDLACLAVALETGCVLFDLASNGIERIPMPEPLPAKARFCDGKCDPWAIPGRHKVRGRPTQTGWNAVSVAT